MLTAICHCFLSWELSAELESIKCIRMYYNTVYQKVSEKHSLLEISDMFAEQPAGII